MDKLKLPTLQELSDRLSAVRSEKDRHMGVIRELEAEESEISFYLEAMRSRIGSAVPQSETNATGSANGRKPKRRRAGRLNKGDIIANLARDVLAENEFLPIDLLVSQMKKRGWTYSDDYIRCRERVRKEMRKRTNTFERHHRGLWRLKPENSSDIKSETP